MLSRLAAAIPSPLSRWACSPPSSLSDSSKRACLSHIAEYFPPRSSSSVWLPVSTTCPFSITAIISHEAAVDSRCATKSEVRPSFILSRLSITYVSVWLSRADVTSSNTRIRGFLRKARARATRCFSPPLSLSPRSPTIVPYPSGSDMTVSWMAAARAAAWTSSSVASMRPYWML
mmetsp:Transcript_18922/g.52776  ORF Transcript_18922/g.52776 Transcript_18922/m.52776 type:complete len:175 (+) Transcript_18922:303-827(+)